MHVFGKLWTRLAFTCALLRELFALPLWAGGRRLRAQAAADALPAKA